MNRRNVATRLLTRRALMQGAALAGLGLLAGCGPLPGQAPAPPPGVFRIGYLGGSALPASLRRQYAFLDGLREHGYVEGQNLIIERRYEDERPVPLPALAAELVALPVDLILIGGGTSAAVAAKQATSTIPIVVPAGDLAGPGLVASLARPGGNVTGITTRAPHVSGKRLELLQAAVPGAGRVAVLWNPATAPAGLGLTEVQVAATGSGWRSNR